MAELKELSEEEFAGWIRCPDAFKRIDISFHGDAVQQIWLRLLAGTLRAAAESAFIDEHPQVVKFLMMLPAFWKSFKGNPAQTAFWRTGNIDSGLNYPALRRVVPNHFIDVRFHPEDFAKIPGAVPDAITVTQAIDSKHEAILKAYGYRTLLPVDQAEPSPSITPSTDELAEPAAQNLGGRPRADWWEDLWIEMCRQIMAGTLKFDTIADVVRAMQDYLQSIHRSAHESTLKRAARKLQVALQKEVQN